MTNKIPRRHNEDDLQKAMVTAAAFILKPEDGILFAVPNGGKREQVEASRLKQMGVRAGVSDLILLLRQGRAVLIEVKVPEMSDIFQKVKPGRHSPEQVLFAKQAANLGHEYVTVRTVDEFVSLLKSKITNQR